MKEEIHHLDGKKRYNIFRTRIKVQFLEQKKDTTLRMEEKIQHLEREKKIQHLEREKNIKHLEREKKIQH
jgi:hypothetical protein